MGCLLHDHECARDNQGSLCSQIHHIECHRSETKQMQCSARNAILPETHYILHEGLVHPQAKGKKQALVYVSGRIADCLSGVDSEATLPGSNPACATYFHDTSSKLFNLHASVASSEKQR